MYVAKKLLNKSEEVVFRELGSIAQDNALRLFAKPRLSDVILKDGPLSQSEFDFYTKAHVDFVVTDNETKPLLIVEYDGPFHADPVQQRRDRVKDDLCANAGLGVLRINANYVTKLYRGMSVLRWIIEVTELEKWFTEAQEAGHLPWDETFDAAMITGIGKEQKHPYWLSASATQALNTFIFDGQNLSKKGWAGIVGSDTDNNLHELIFCWFGDHVIYSKTAVRRQNFRFPVSDLLREISTCELGLKLKEYQNGNLQPISGVQLQQIGQSFCNRYDAYPSFSCGSLGPFNASWSSALG